MSPDQPSWMKEIGKGFVNYEQLKKEGPSRRMEKVEPNHDSKNSTKNPLPTVKQGADPGIQTRMTQDQPSQVKEIGKGFVCNKQSEREGSSRRMEKSEPNHSPKNPYQGAESNIEKKLNPGQPSWPKETGKGLVYNKHSERRGPPRRMERLGSDHDSGIRESLPTASQNQEPKIREESERSPGPNNEK